MSISNYTELRTAISDFMARNDISGRAATCIQLAEARIRRELKPVLVDAPITGVPGSTTRASSRRASEMFALLGGIKSALSLLAGALVAAGIFWLWNTAYDNPRIQRAAMAEGQAIERRAWEAEMVRVKAEADAARLRAQAEIDRIERAYLAQRDADREAIASLEEIISELEAEDAAETPAGEPARPRVLLDKRLRDAIQPVGRNPR